VCNNTITASQLPTIEGAARYGNGVTVDYGAQAELHNNVIVGNANYGVGVLDSSRITMSENVMRGNGSDVVWLDATSDQQRLLDLPQSCQELRDFQN
jgi:parallel beta-helix repeat protein